MSDDLIRQKARERHFLEQLLDSRKLENYTIPVPIKAELRKYQQVGGAVDVPFHSKCLCLNILIFNTVNLSKRLMTACFKSQTLLKCVC